MIVFDLLGPLALVWLAIEMAAGLPSPVASRVIAFSGDD